MALRPTIYSSISRAIGSTVLGGGFSGLLDQYPGAAAAYSLRALSAGWLAGDVVEVRRSSDSATDTFTASQITGGDLLAFCAGGDGFVSTWYDQSGNGNNATQPTTTEQPKIVDAGSLVIGGLDFVGLNNNALVSINNAAISQKFTSIHVSSSSNSGTSGAVIAQGADPTTFEWFDSYRSTGAHALNAGSTVESVGYALGTEYLKFSVFDNGSTSISVNGSVTSGLTAGAGGGTTKFLIGRANLLELNGTIAEIIVYNSDQSANRSAIESNLNDHYGIY